MRMLSQPLTPRPDPSLRDRCSAKNQRKHLQPQLNLECYYLEKQVRCAIRHVASLAMTLFLP
jgi:hypothetical protein